MPSNSIESCAEVSATLPTWVIGQMKRPRSSRLEKRHIPCPSYHEQLDQMTALASKRKQRARMRTLLQRLLNQHRETINAFTHIGDPTRQPHLGHAGAG